VVRCALGIAVTTRRKKLRLHWRGTPSAHARVVSVQVVDDRTEVVIATDGDHEHDDDHGRPDHDDAASARTDVDDLCDHADRRPRCRVSGSSSVGVLGWRSRCGR
jgi:hypothetical protein